MNFPKRTLVALASLATATGALSQSSVTLFGVLDTSVAHIRSAGTDVTGLSSGGESSSRFGIRGVEDLGAGLKAGFWLESGIGVDTGTGSGRDDRLSFDRRSTASLSSRNWGELRLGRDKTPAYLNIETFDPFGDIGVGGYGGQNLIGGTTTAVGTPEGSNPKCGEKGSGVPNDRLRDAASLRAGYKRGPVDLGFGYGQIRGGTTAAGVDYRSSNVGAAYDFGVVKPMVLFATERGNGRRVDLLGVGISVPFGKGEFRASFSSFRRKDIDDADSTKLALGYGYDFSKRTQVYGTFARVRNDAAATRGLAVSSSALATPAVNAGAGVTGFELGVRHSF